MRKHAEEEDRVQMMYRLQKKRDRDRDTPEGMLSAASCNAWYETHSYRIAAARVVEMKGELVLMYHCP